MRSAKKASIGRPRSRRSVAHPAEDSIPVAVFTALEGSLVDFETFDHSAARPVVQRLFKARVPIVPVTVMTLDEVTPIVEELGLRGPMIIEAGAAIARMDGDAWSVEALGPPADVLVDAICEIETMTGADLLVYSALSEQESARLSGRKGQMLHASLQRRFSEPFLIERGDIAAVKQAASALGFRVDRGQRFYHLSRETDSDAFSRLRKELHCQTVIGVGGSDIDAHFLSRAEVQIIIPRSDGSVDPDLLEKVQHAIVAPAPGNVGWARSVAQVWTAALSSPARALTAGGMRSYRKESIRKQ